MQEGFAAERSRRPQDFDIESHKRRDDYHNMEKTMTAKMEEGFRNEQQAKQQAQKEIPFSPKVITEMRGADVIVFRIKIKSVIFVI